MLVGYMRVSKTDGSQVLDLQKDALLATGVEARHLYDDRASGMRDDRPGLTHCLKALREGDTLDMEAGSPGTGSAASGQYGT
jgi:DNA invertase Pin-like site-specific DNA recombinase